METKVTTGRKNAVPDIEYFSNMVLHEFISRLSLPRLTIGIMFPFEKILNYVANEQCALVIGPEIMHFKIDAKEEEGEKCLKPMNMYLLDKIYHKFKNEVSHYYDKEGLFLFPANDESVKSDVAQSLKNECHNLPDTPCFDEEIFKSIARLPFHLVISINPDTFLSDTFYKFGITHRFSHFRKGEHASDDVAPPTREEPLIYNLAGSILEDESLILDYEDLFSFISSSLGTYGLPSGLQSALEKVRTYVFLGFPFEKWYTQLMLRILCGKAAYRKYAGPHKIDSASQVFLANQFKIDFWKPDCGDFLQSFLQAAAKYKDTDPKRANRPFMRNLLQDPLTPEETNIVREIQNGNTAAAINNLLSYALKTDYENAAIQLSGQYQNLMKDRAKMEYSEYLPALNRISDAVLKAARDIANEKGKP